MIIHVVKEGETINAIAKQYGVSEQRIIVDNGLLPPYVLTIGQALIVLIPDVVYEVQKGDTLIQIAKAYNTTVMNLVQNNPELLSERFLQKGQEIVISYQGTKLRDVTINGYAYPYISRPVLLRALPYLTKLTIFGYGFNEEGELIEPDDEPLIQLALDFSAKPILLFSSMDENGTFSSERASILFNDIAFQNQMIEKLLEKMEEKRYEGIDIDFEFIKVEDKQAYVNFVKNVSEKFDAKGYTVNVDLAPKISATQPGLLYEGHDYAQLSAAADTVLVMTYEWGYTYGHPSYRSF